jgi:hypothetical protein
MKRKHDEIDGENDVYTLHLQVYSFSLYPESFQPVGHVNLTRYDKLTTIHEEWSDDFTWRTIS